MTAGTSGKNKLFILKFLFLTKFKSMKQILLCPVILFFTLSIAIAQPARPPLTNDNAVIYELFLRDFTQEESIQAVIPRLPELKALGINTIWIMPIHPVGKEKMKGPLGSPYSVQNFYA